MELWNNYAKWKAHSANIAYYPRFFCYINFIILSIILYILYAISWNIRVEKMMLIFPVCTGKDKLIFTAPNLIDHSLQLADRE